MIKKTRLKPNIIYKNNKIILEVKEKDNILLISNSNYTTDDFVRTLKKFSFLPNTMKKISFPNFSLKLPSLRMVNDKAAMQSSFMELKTHKIQFNKITDPTVIPEEFLSKPVIVDTSIYRNEFNNYAIKSKRNTVSLRGLLKNILELMIKQTRPSNVKSNFVIHLDKEYDPFVATMIQALNIPKDFFPLFDKLNIIFVTHNDFIFIPDFSKITSKGIIQSRLKKLLELATSVETIEPSSDVEVIVPDDKDIEVSKELEKDEVQDANDLDQSELASTATTPIDSVTDSKPDIEIDDDDDIHNDVLDMDTDDEVDTSAVSKMDIDTEINPVEPVIDDFDEILKSSAINDIELEFIRMAEENKEFLQKNIHKQEAAISILQKEADELSSDKELNDLTITDDTIISENVKRASLMSITSSYYEKQFKKDMLENMKSLNNDPEYPVIITKIEVVNNSTPLTKSDTYKVTFLDKKYKQHNFSVDVPKLSHDGFMFVNGNKKFISKQATPVPVIKETHDRVQITTNYRKAFLYRKGEKTSGQGDRLLKLFTNSSFTNIDKVVGDSTKDNVEYDVSINYNYLAKKLFQLTINGSAAKYDFYFNQNAIREAIKKKSKTGLKFDDTKYIPIGFVNSNKLLIENIKTRKIFSVAATTPEPKLVAANLIEYLSSIVEITENEELQSAYKRTKASTRLSYTEIKIAAASLSLGILIALYKGLLNSLDLYNIKYRIEEKRVAKKDSETILAFKDTYLYIDNEYNSEKEIFINGLVFLDTNNYLLEETFMYAPIYLDYLGKVTGSKNTSKALNNFEHSMIDPITLEILQELKLPTKFPELLLYANSLLGSLNHNRKNDMANFRIRDSEVISVAVYNSLMNAFNMYKRSMRTGIVQPINTKDDTVLRMIQDMPNVEDYSTLNPFLEAEVKSKTTFKGPSGLNSSQAYTAEIRSYHESMLGLYGIYTPIGPEVGVNRSMVLNPKIKSTRGFIQPFDLENSDATNLFSIGELLNVFTAKHSDSPRAIMATVQGKHITPTKVQHPYLVGNGSDKLLPHLVGSDFSKRAQDDGVIEELKPKLNLCIVKYKDGTRSIIDLHPKVAKNSGGGFYTENKLQLVKDFKVGDKVKKGQILAIDDNFFKKMLDGSIGFASGALTKIAVAALPETFEDSSVVTQKVVKNLTSEVINERRIVLSKNTRLKHLSKIGDTVQIDTPLAIFEDMGEEGGEGSLFADFEKLDDLSKSTIDEYARSVAKAKYAGEIFDIQIFYNCDPEEMHPTMKKLVNDYKAIYEIKGEVINTARDNEIIYQPSTEQIKSDKIMGDEVDGVVIRFFIKHEDSFKVGDKLCFAIALKAIVAETVEEGKEPYSSYDSSETVDALISPLSIVSRNTPDLYNLGYTTKIIIELEKQCLKLLEEK